MTFIFIEIQNCAKCVLNKCIVDVYILVCTYRAEIARGSLYDVHIIKDRNKL